MNESLVRKFCESRHRKLIVVIGTTLFGLLVLIPLVDEYFDHKESRNTFTENLGRARQTAEAVPKLEQTVTKIVRELEAIESRTVNEESLSQYRTKLVDLVRETGCQVRRLDVSTPTLRPWFHDDNPLKNQVASAAKKRKTSFTLERRSVRLSVDGSTENVQSLLKQLHSDETLSYLRRLNLNSGSRKGETVNLELEMWLFALGKQKV